VQINNIFSSSFKNYKIVFLITAHSTTLGYQLRFRTGGVTNSNANYAYVTQTTSSASGSTVQSIGRTQTVAPLTQTTTAAPYSFELNIYDPFTSAPSFYWYEGEPSVANREVSNGAFNANQSFDGISIIATAGNMTGSFKVYGLRD